MAGEDGRDPGKVCMSVNTKKKKRRENADFVFVGTFLAFKMLASDVLEGLVWSIARFSGLLPQNRCSQEPSLGKPEWVTRSAC